jgi:hypothetical protein
MTAPLDTAGMDHERIWLEPRTPDDLYGHEGRTWCQDKVWPTEWDDAEPTEYVRADLYEALSRELAEARAALERVRDDCQSTIDLYYRSGPSFTSPGGDHYEPSSFVVEKMEELVAVCAHVLSREKEASHD